MPAHCPKCDARLSWLKLKGAFRCPSCKAALTAKTLWPWLATIVVWSLADIPLRVAIQAPDGTAGYLIVAVRSLVSFCIGYLIGAFIVGSYSSVSLASQEHGTPEA